MYIKLLSQKRCAPCKVVKLFLESEEVDFETIDVGEHKDVSEKYEVRSTPVTILFNGNDKEVARVCGDDIQGIELLLDQI